MAKPGKLMDTTLIPGADYRSSVKYAKGNTANIITEVLNCFKDGKQQLKDFAPQLRGSTLKKTCNNIWDFIHDNIRYQEDPGGKQWVREPARLWADGVGDCKSFSVFALSCCYCLGINAMFRFVSFSEINPDPTHVYVVVPGKQGDEIIIDAVVSRFNYQKPFTYKIDYMTEISRLSGVNDIDENISIAKYTPPGKLFPTLWGSNEHIGGFFDGLFLDPTRRKRIEATMPGLINAFAYMFIPVVCSPACNRVQTNWLAMCPPIIKQKRDLANKAVQFINGKAGYKGKDFHILLANSFQAKNGMSGEQFWSKLLGFDIPASDGLVQADAMYGIGCDCGCDHMGGLFDIFSPKDSGSGGSIPTDPGSAATSATSVGFNLLLGLFGGLIPKYGWEFPSDAQPQMFAPYDGDWSGFRNKKTGEPIVFDLAYDVPGGGTVSAGSVYSPASTPGNTSYPQLPASIPAGSGGNTTPWTYDNAANGSTLASINPLVLLGVAGAALLLVMNKGSKKSN